MEKKDFVSKEEKVFLIEALKRLISERKIIYEGYQKYYEKINNFKVNAEIKDEFKFKEKK